MWGSATFANAMLLPSGSLVPITIDWGLESAAIGIDARVRSFLILFAEVGDGQGARATRCDLRMGLSPSSTSAGEHSRIL
jgi:hypothetical protein